MTRISRASLILASVLTLTWGTPVSAEATLTGIVLVTGKIGSRERAVIESAIKTELRKTSWSMSAQSFTSEETALIVRCLADDNPWHCLGPIAQSKGVDRIVVAEVNPQSDSATKLLITGEFVVAGNGPAAVRQRHCDACDDKHLSDAAQQLTVDLLADMENRSETVLALQIAPAGATVLLDDRPIGNADAAGRLSHATLPGPHKLAIQHAGFVKHERDVDLPVAKTTRIDVSLMPLETSRRLLVPMTVAGAGVLVLGTGIALQATAESPPVGQPQPRYVVSTPGIVLMAGGGVAIGVAVYLWLASNKRAAPAAGATATVTDRGAIVGWTGQF